MKTKLQTLMSQLLLLFVGLILSGVYLLQPRLSLPETAGRVEPARLTRKVVPASSLGLIGPAAQPAPADVVPFVQTLHIHGISYEEARQFGPDAVPILLGLLADPANEPYAPNIVVTLGFIGHTSTRQPLLDYLTRTQGEVSLDRFRGLTAVPFALSQLAHQGDVASLEFLLQASEPGYWNAQTLPWTFNGQLPQPDLFHQTLLGLGLSGQPQALARLEQLANQGGLSAQADNEALQQARNLNQRVRQEGMAPVVNPDPTGLVSAEDVPGAIDSQAADANPQSHLHRFTVARHVSMSSPSNTQVDAFLSEASRIIQTADSAGDISCCVALQRNGSVGTFNVSDGTIDQPSELNAVFGVSSHQVKVAPSLAYCGGQFNPSIIGCAPIASRANLVLEYLNNPTFDGILWAHEFGHNQGLVHPNPGVSSRIMNGSLSAGARQMTQAECTAWHSTSANPGAVTGPCSVLFTVSKILQPGSEVKSGATLHYVVTIVNNTASPVANITLSDDLPGQLTYIQGSASANPPLIASFSNFPSGTSSFTLNGNSSIQISYAVKVGSVGKGQLLVNTAKVNIPGLSQPIQASYTAIANPFKTYLPLILRK